MKDEKYMEDNRREINDIWDLIAKLRLRIGKLERKGDVDD